ncbi:MAG: DUF5688 family protein, partial [Brevinema sp.]
MDINQTIEYVKENILKYMPEEFKDHEVKIEEISKNNNVKLWGLFIRGDEKVVPTMYIGEELYRIHYRTDKENIVKEIAEKYLDAVNQSNTVAQRKITFDDWKTKVYPCVINAEKNAEMLKAVPHECREDLAIIYRMEVEIGAEQKGSIVINNEILKDIEIGHETLKKNAWDNIQVLNPPELQSMEAIMFNMATGEKFPENENSLQNASMLVLGSADKIQGAVYMFDNKML